MASLPPIAKRGGRQGAVWRAYRREGGAHPLDGDCQPGPLQAVQRLAGAGGAAAGRAAAGRGQAVPGRRPRLRGCRHGGCGGASCCQGIFMVL